MFVEPIADPWAPSYAVASSIWPFLHGLFSVELGESWWPFDAAATGDADPDLAALAGVLGLPWEA